MRPEARRRGGSLGITAGILAVGVSLVLLLASGPRQLGEEGFSGLALAFTLANVFGLGVAQPTEQLITRRLNSQATADISKPILWLVTAAMSAGALGLALGETARAAEAYPRLGVSVLLALIGWTACAIVRGRLAGAGDLTMYAAVLGVEATARVLLVGWALLDRDSADWALGAAVGVPLIAAAAVGLWWRCVWDHIEVEAPVRGAEHASFVLFALGFQACLNAPPLLLDWRSGSTMPALVGAFVAANTYFRTPTVLVGGITTHALVDLSHAWGQRDHGRFRKALRTALGRTLLVAGGATALACAAGWLLLPAYYGSSLGLPTLLLCAFPASSMLAVLAATATQPLLAADRGGAAASAWVMAAVATLAPLSASDGTDTLAAAALVAGPAVALTCVSAHLLRVLRISAEGPGRGDVRTH